MKKPLKSSRRVSAEPLESRTLLSLTWSTDYSNTDARITVRGMAADNAGDVYAVGTASPNNTPVVRERTPDGTWTTIATLTLDDTGGTGGMPSGVAVDFAGDVFIAAQAYGTDGANYARIFELPAGQTGVFKIIDNFRLGSGNPYALATDAAGDVFATEVAYIKVKPSQYAYAGEIRKLVPDAASATGFTGSTVYTNTSVRFPFPSGLTVVNGGPSAGIYAVGDDLSTGRWLVLKSSDGGSSWSAVDQFKYDPNAPATVNGGPTNGAHAVIADPAGNVYVAGVADQAVISGYNKNHTPIYTYVEHWIVRQSATGTSGSWNTVQDYLPSGAQQASASGIGEDLAGNTYVIGTTKDSTGQIHAVIMSNEGGSWFKSDDYTDPYFTGGYTAFTCDSAGNLYASGNTSIVRTAAGPAPATVASSTAQSIAAFSATPISSSSSSPDSSSPFDPTDARHWRERPARGDPASAAPLFARQETLTNSAAP